MPEMRTMSCPTCAAKNQPFTVVDGMEEYRCGGCGLVYYGPCGCDTHRSAEEAQAIGRPAVEVLAGDWQMSTTPVELDDVAGIKKYPGCS